MPSRHPGPPPGAKSATLCQHYSSSACRHATLTHLLVVSLALLQQDELCRHATLTHLLVVRLCPSVSITFLQHDATLTHLLVVRPWPSVSIVLLHTTSCAKAIRTSHTTLTHLLVRTWLVGWVLLYVHRNSRLIRDGSPGRPARLSHSSWALLKGRGRLDKASNDPTSRPLTRATNNNPIVIRFIELQPQRSGAAWKSSAPRPLVRTASVDVKQLWTNASLWL